MNQSRGWAEIKTQVEKLPPGALTGTVSAREKMICDSVVLLHYFMSNTLHGKSVYFLARTQTPKDFLYIQMQLMRTFCVVNQFFAAQYI